MVQVVSKFKVANGIGHLVSDAFLNRPRLVKHAEGFVSMEVFTDSSDASIFYLSTRWSSESAYREWHSSDAHHASHKGIPKGLKLDPAFTQLTVMDFLCR